MTAPLVFLDTETDGLYSDRRPWEIALIRRDERKADEHYVLQVADIDLSNAELIGLNIGRFYDRHQAIGRGRTSRSLPQHTEHLAALSIPESEVAQRVERITRGAHIVGAVPSFDAECLAAMLRRHKLVPAWHYHLIDIEAMAAGWLLRTSHAIYDQSGGDDGIVARAEEIRATAIPPWKSDELSRAFGVEPPGDEERHTAMGDALWVQRWYDRMVGDA